MRIQQFWKFANKGLLIILSILVVFSLLSMLYLARTLTGLNKLLDQSADAIESAFVLQDLVINLQVIESGPRGYVMTGDERYLVRYEESISKIEEDIRRIKSDNLLDLENDQTRRIIELSESKVRFVRELIDIRQNVGEEEARAMLIGLQGEELMAQLMEEIDTIAETRLSSIETQQNATRSSVERSLVVAGATAMFVVAVCAAVIWNFHKAILRERSLENTKSEFLSLASHQLRTPATNVKQYIGLLLDGYMGDLTDKQRQALMVAYKNNESEITIMNNLLDVAKLDLNRIQLNKKPVNLAKTARHIVGDYRKVAEERQQEITLVSDRSIMAVVDGAYIKSVMENLLDNALKYSKENTRITMKLYLDGDDVYIAVKDRGLGIKRKDMGKLFKKFSRLDNEFSANSTGSGLGLYWVKQIVDLHGGRIIISSKEGKGSSFTVCLPVS